ncbi:MAG TPA: hypothetical protein VNA24_15260 [Hyalangium sp.]|nr:hypothetical protein [Hyalangium sp.]
MRKVLATGLLILCALPAFADVEGADRAAIKRMQQTKRRPDPKGGVVQVNGKDTQVGQTTFPVRVGGDPFVYVKPDGKVNVLTSDPNMLELKSLDDLLRGGPFKVKSNEQYIEGRADRLVEFEVGWDSMIHRWPDGTEVLYSSLMDPELTRKGEAKWPDHNWSRRIYPFVRDAKGRWVIRDQPLFNPIDRTQPPTMVGHTYGHHFKTVTRDTPTGPVTETWLFHEEIIEDKPKLKTEIFARKMLDPFTASTEKVHLLGVGDPPYPSAIRENGELLVEGPRPFEAVIDGETLHFISFSSGDYSRDQYDIHFAYRRGDAIGPYTPLLRTENGVTDFTPFGERIKRKYALSWLGRAHVIRDSAGRSWAVFHAVNKLILPDFDYSKTPARDGLFNRNIYVVPITFGRAPNGEPLIELKD